MDLKLLDFYKKFPQVKAIAIGGSNSAKTSDEISDIDIYVFINDEISINERENFVREISTKYEVGGEYFGSGDEYLVDSLNVQFDVMFWDVNWFENVIGLFVIQIK